jgi:hypothetical protein
MTFLGLAEGGGEEMRGGRAGVTAVAGARRSARRGSASARASLGAGEVSPTSAAARAGGLARAFASAVRTAGGSATCGAAFSGCADTLTLSSFVSDSPDADATVGSAADSAVSMSRWVCGGGPEG